MSSLSHYLIVFYRYNILNNAYKMKINIISPFLLIKFEKPYTANQIIV